MYIYEVVARETPWAATSGIQPNLTMLCGELAMDFIVDLLKSSGSTTIWTIVDLFSNKAHFIMCPKLSSTWVLVKMFVQHVYRLHGVSKHIISDWGLQFMAKFWWEFLKLIGSSQGLSSAFHPSTSRVAE